MPNLSYLAQPFTVDKSNLRMQRMMVSPPLSPRPPVVDMGKLLAPVRGGLQQVEAKMKGFDSSLFAPLANAFLELIGSGGKRLRPALALLSAECSGTLREPGLAARVIALAAAVEMLHTSTLVHDDVIDGALLRRGAPTLNALWNGGSTVLAGNYMFGCAAQFSAETQHPRVIRLFSETLRVIVDGELRQLSARYDYAQEKNNYYERIYAKTASLFCAATEGAAILARMPEPAVVQLRDFGYNFGMAFQIIDDILDFTGNATTLGKPAGSDLGQGTLTLPFFYFLQQHSTPDRLLQRLENAQVQAEDGDGQPWAALVQETVALVTASPAIELARQEARDFIAQAQGNLADFPESVAKESMLGLCEFVVQRTY
jgi:geranylgeranyl pyrophosphate synthase